MPRRSFFMGDSGAAALQLGMAVRASGGGAGGEELVDGELHMAEDLAGVLLAVAAGALLLGHAVVVHRHEQLGVPLQPDDGELAQSDIDPLALTAAAQLAVEAAADAGRNVGQLAVAVMALAYIHQLHVQDDGVHDLHHPHQIGRALLLRPQKNLCNRRSSTV